jgi:predicted ATPase/class 3 adenylate cyclase
VTFLFTDIEGSTQRWEQYPDAMQAALARHDELLRAAIEQHSGHVVKTTGDGFLAAFGSAADAALAAIVAQQSLADEPWPDEPGPLPVRMGLHSGEAQARDGDYYGTALNRAARLMSVGHGGQVLLSGSTEALLGGSLPPEVSVVDLGLHRLRDLAEPVAVFQLVHSALRSTFPPLRSLDVLPGNLPVQLTSFVGRERELRQITGALASARLVTLTGTGGVGKTRLALQAAADVLPRFADGAWLCELAGAGDASAMVELVAATLRVVPRVGRTAEESILDFLVAKRIVLVLDNCEHLLDPVGCFVEAVLQSCAEVSVLATSREGLAVPGEQLLPLRSLGVPTAATDDVDDAVATDAVRLFVERASAARPGFSLDPANVGAVVEICRRLDGVPLAIELAAVRVASMTPAEIAGLLDERFRLLAGGRRNAVERHQTLRATVEWSYELLNPLEQQVFDRIGVFSGAFEAAAATAVGGCDDLDPWDVRDALASLVAKSMVLADDVGDVTHYLLLETMRQYALERLRASDDVDRVRRVHAEHYAAWAEVVGPALMGADELAWRVRFHDSLDNFRAAFTWAMEEPGEDGEGLAVRMVAALADQGAHDLPSGVGTWAERIAEPARAAAPGLRTAVLGAAAFSALHRGAFDLLDGYVDDALRDDIPPDCPAPSPALMARCLRPAASLADLDLITTARERLELIGAADHNRTHMFATEGLLAYQLKEYERAAAAAEQALECARRVRNPTGLVVSLTVWAVSFGEQLPGPALAAAQESIALTNAGASDGVYSLAVGVASRLLAPIDRRASLRQIAVNFDYFRDSGSFLAAYAAVVGTSDVMRQIEEPEVAAVLLGSKAGILGLVPERFWSYVDWVDATRARLGDERYEAASARGASMALDELLAYASTEIDRAWDEAG